MLVGELKEGRTRLNDAARDPAVPAAAHKRFGCCGAEEAPEVVAGLIRSGHALTAGGHQVRMVAFGQPRTPPKGTRRFRLAISCVSFRTISRAIGKSSVT